MKVWLMLNSVAVAAIGALVFLILRQLGFLLQRAGPMGARGTDDGPRLGESIASHFPPFAANDRKSKLFVFMSTHCAVCGHVRKGAEQLSRAWHRDAEIFLIYDCTNDQDTGFEIIAPGLKIKRDSSLREKLGVSFVPFAAVTDPLGQVVSKGLVNDITHLESLLEVEREKRARRVVDVPSSNRRIELETTTHQS